LTVDQVVIDCVQPGDAEDANLKEWHRMQAEFLQEMVAYFAPVPVRCLPLVRQENLGLERIRALARELFQGDEDPAAVTRTERPYSFSKRNGVYEVRLQAPFAAKGEIRLFKKDGQLIVQVGTVRRHIGLPASMTGLSPVRARLENNTLVVELQEAIR
jgi:arsenite-transporting ATPase